MSDAKAPSSTATEANPQKRVEPQAQPASAAQESAQPASGVALLERGSTAAPPGVPGDVLGRTANSTRGLGPTPIDYLLHVQRRHGNRQVAGLLAVARATAKPEQKTDQATTPPAQPAADRPLIARASGPMPSIQAKREIRSATLNSSQPAADDLPGLQRTVAPGSAVIQRLPVNGLNGTIQREACPAPPVPPMPKAPTQDPKFVAVKGNVGKVAGQEKAHAPAAAKATEAQKAAAGPPNEVASQAAAAQVTEMGSKEPGAFDKKAFVEAVKQAIAKITPKNQEEADDFKKSGKAGQIKQEVGGMVTKGKEGAEKPIKETAQAAPDTGKASPKPVTPMQAEQPGPPPPAVGAASAMPSPRPPQQVSLAAGPCETNDQMAEAGVTETQLKKSNEPEFTGALDAKKKAEVHSATAPKAVRAEEQATLGKAQSAAATIASSTTAKMHQGRTGALTAITGGKAAAKGQDEAKRAEIATKIEGIYNAAKKDVTDILNGLDGKVNTAFENGEKAARAAFENHVETKMTAYKDKRYSGLDGAATWLVDKLMGMPPEVNAFYTEGRNLYLSRMDGVINTVAGVVETELTKAKARIAKGKKEVAVYVASLPKSLQKIGGEVQGQFQEKFAQLDQDINAKQDELVQGLAQKYAEARDKIDERIGEMQAENKGLVDAAKDAIGGVIETIKNLKAMLLNTLSRAAGAIDKIIADPIGFLGNLVSAIKQGLMQFVNNIGKHLKDGLMGWLLGELAAAGITLPKSLDFKGILDLVMQVMGLTYNAIRSRAVKLVGEPVVKKIEQVAEVFKVLITEGPAGLWKWIVDKVDNLVDTVLGGIKDLVITKVVVAGITWLVSLLNPASAFVKACKMIYDVIMFFVERGSQIMALVNAIIDSVEAIASGAIGAAANWVENALAKALPVAISFLASLLGLGGLSDKIKKIIEAVQKPVGKAVDAVINTVVKGFKKVAGFVGGLFGKGKDKDKPDDRTPAQKETAEKNAIKDAEKLLEAPDATPGSVRSKLPAIKSAYNLTTISLVDTPQAEYQVVAEIQRMTSRSVRLAKGKSGKGPYKHLTDPAEVEAGKDFLPTQKEAIIAANKARNSDGFAHSDLSGIRLVPPKKSMSGVTPAPNEWQIDHIIPRDQDGNNSYANAQVLSRRENRAKWNT